MSHIRSITNILTDVQQIIEDMNEHEDVLTVGLELAHQLLEELQTVAEEIEPDESID